MVGNGPPAVNPLVFDSATHTYRLGGVHVPSVTQILERLGFYDATWYTEHSRLRGVLVHRAIELRIAGDLPEDHGVTEAEPYLNAWERFCQESIFTPICSELRLASPCHRYAGTIDVLGVFHRHGRGVPALLDLKTGQRQHWWPIQLAGYQILALENGMGARHRYNLQLSGDGSYSLWEAAAPNDRNVFLAALLCWKYLESKT